MPTAPSPSPQRVLCSARKGVEESLGELLGLYVNYLHLLAHTQIDTRLQARVSPSDVVQETLYEAHRDFPQLQGESEREFLGWLRKILIHNLSRQVERHVLTEKRDVRREVSLEQMGQMLERSTARLEAILVDGGDSPSSDAGHRERAVLLADALTDLPGHYRKVLVLRHLEGLSFEQIAEQMDRSSGAVRMLWLRAIERLRQWFDAKDLI